MHVHRILLVWYTDHMDGGTPLCHCVYPSIWHYFCSHAIYIIMNFFLKKQCIYYTILLYLKGESNKHKLGKHDSCSGYSSKVLFRYSI
jgi:hypothetical protein